MPFYILPFKPFSASFCPLVSGAVIKYPCEAHHTFEAKLRNASTLLWLGRATLLALQAVAKYTFHFVLYLYSANTLPLYCTLL
jgi:hypothetical protein